MSDLHRRPQFPQIPLNSTNSMAEAKPIIRAQAQGSPSWPHQGQVPLLFHALRLLWASRAPSAGVLGAGDRPQQSNTPLPLPSPPTRPSFRCGWSSAQARHLLPAPWVI